MVSALVIMYTLYADTPLRLRQSCVCASLMTAPKKAPYLDQKFPI